MEECSELLPVNCGCGGKAEVYQDGNDFLCGCTLCGTETNWYGSAEEAVAAWNTAMGATDMNVGSKERIIHCSECAHWMDRCVLMNDGRIRQYKANENFVTIAEGMNEGSKCLYDDRCIEDGCAIFRDKDDFCSKAEKRQSSYEEWYGIKDGIYAKRWKDE